MAETLEAETPAAPPARQGAIAQLRELPWAFWGVNTMEMLERLAYYGVRLVIPIYVAQADEAAGLLFSQVEKGQIFTLWALVQTGVPMFSGGFADRYGYKRTVAASIAFKVAGYLLMATQRSYWPFTLGCLTLAFGTAIFKPVSSSARPATLLHQREIQRPRSARTMEVTTDGGDMDAALRWLRISYWVGAIVDAVAAAQMLHPPLFAFGMNLTVFTPGDGWRYAMGMGASLMLGWTALLLWADREPVRRRGVLPLTTAVVAALAANEALAVRAGYLPVGPVVAIWLLQACLAALFIGSYAFASRAAIAEARLRPTTLSPASRP